jgi:hypothetical protein
MASLRHPIMVERSQYGSGMGAWLHLSPQLVHLCVEHQVNCFMGCDYNIETSLAHLKTTMRMDVLHCKTVPGVLKELTIFAIVYNLVRIVMWHSAILQHITVERISFLDALRWLSAPSTGMPLIALIVNPARPYRVEPRVKKRRSKSFPLMVKPRQELRRQLVQQTLGG